MRLVNTKYAFITAYLKGEEAGAVSREHLEEMLERPTIPDLLEVIRKTNIGDFLWREQAKAFREFELSLLKYLNLNIKQIMRFRPPADVRRLVTAYMTKFDIQNIKALLRQARTGMEARLVPLGAMHDSGYLERLEGIRTLEGIEEVLKRSDLNEYLVTIREIEEKDDRSHTEGEIRLDSRYFLNLRKTASSSIDGPIIIKALGTFIDILNLQVVFRSVLMEKRDLLMESFLEGGHMITLSTVREFLSLKLNEITGKLERTEYHKIARQISKSYEKDGDVTVIERTIERQKLHLLKDLLSPRSMSPAAILWYLFIKELEIRNIRMIAKGLTDGIPSLVIKNNLVSLA